MVNSHSLVGGGLRKPAYGVWDPLWWSQNHLKVGDVGESADVQGTTLPCSLLPKLVEAYRKFEKIKQAWIPEVWVVDSIPQKF